MNKATGPIIYSLNKKGAAQLLPVVSESDHKYSRGRCLLLAGSAQYPGAGLLAAQAALRMGCGYVTLAQKNIQLSLQSPDFLLCDLDKQDWQDIKFDAILVGPGFGVNSFTASVILEMKKQRVEKVVLDADALSVCAQEKIFPLPSSWIVTPHVAELARCLGVSVSEINSNRYSAIRKAQNLFGCVVLLKGHGTLITGKQRLYKNKTGNAALAKAGTGDVLAGIITALRGQGLSPVQSALLGAYVHGATANLWRAQKKDLLSMRAVDVIEALPEVLYELRQVYKNSVKKLLTRCDEES